MVFKQIAGLIARRIVCYKKAGDMVDAGERVGLIKFGSRVDVFLGPEWEVAVRVGERVSAGSSVIARRSSAMNLRERLIDPQSPERRPRRAAYALPTLFTAANIFLGFYAHSEVFQGAMRLCSGLGRRRPSFPARRHGHRRRGVFRWSGRPHRAHDQHGQRFRPRNGFARRRDRLRHRARGAGVRLGRAVRRRRSTS